jgi:signal transduction histidine kinase
MENFMTSQEESIPIKSIPEIFRVQSAILAAQAETTIDGILVVSGEGKILFANRRFRELWAIPEAVILNGADAAALKMATEQVCDPDEFLARVKYLYQHRDQVLRDEVRLRDGRVFDRYTAPLLGEDKTYYGRIWYFRDVTESKHNAMLEHERVSLRKAVAAMKQALRVVRQELRAPLAVLRAISELLLEVRSRNTPDFEQLLVALHTQTLRLSDAVENLLEPARCDGGPARWSWGTVVLSEVCCKAIEGISTQVDANAVSLAFRVDQPAATCWQTRRNIPPKAESISQSE